MTVTEKLLAVANNVPLVYAAGKGDCEGRHYVAVTAGHGRTIEFSVPFEPDFISISCYDPRAMAQPGSILQFCADRRALSNLAGLALSSREGMPYNAGLSHSALETRLTVADGLVQVRDIPSALGATNGVFLAGVPYVVMAHRYTEQSDARRLTDFLQALAGKSGTFTLSQKIVTGAFPDADRENAAGESMNEAWNELLRQYAANCTIALA